MMSIGVGRQAGATFNATIRVTLPGGSQVTCSPLVVIPVTGEGRQMPGHPTILLPGTLLSLRIEDGDAASSSATTIYFVEAPIGTVFYV